MPYARRPSDIKVFHYQGERHADWPEWLQEYSVYTPLGAAGVSYDGIGTLIVPTVLGTAAQCTKGDYIVWEDGRVEAYRAHVFGEIFEQTED